MKCFRCQSERLHLAALTPYHRGLFADCGIVMRICKDCGLAQNHRGLGEPLTPEQAAAQAPVEKIE